MRAQSAVEFLSTYGFMFAILGIAIALSAFLATSASSGIPSQCNSYAGPSCNFVSLYSNLPSQYSLVTLSITNTQSVPINITNVSVSVRGAAFPGICAPQLVYPGQEATCVANATIAPSIGSQVQGSYLINAGYCNQGISSISKGGCSVPSQANYERVSYGGSFTVSALPQQLALFSVAAAVGPANFQGMSYNSFIGSSPFSNNGPAIPLNFTIVQNGDWVSNVSAGTLVYSFETANNIGAPFYGRNTILFPQSTSLLGVNSIACSGSFNSTLSLASTVVYVTAPGGSSIAVTTDNAIEIFLKPAPSLSNGNWIVGNWVSAYQGAAWGVGSFGPASVPLNAKGLYYLEVLWENTCGPGVQEFYLKLPGT